MRPSFGVTTTRKGRRRKGASGLSWGDGYGKRVYAAQFHKSVERYFKKVDEEREMRWQQLLSSDRQDSLNLRAP